MLLIFTLAGCNACTGVPATTPVEIIEEVQEDQPPGVGGEVLASNISKEFLGAFGKATKADSTLTLGEALDIALVTTQTGLVDGQVWDRRIAHSQNLTVGDAFTMAANTIETAIVAAGLKDLTLYSPDMPYADLGNALANEWSDLVLGSFDDGYVTIGEVVSWPLAITQTALTMTGESVRVVGTVSGASAPTTIGDLYSLGVTVTQATLKSLKLWDVLLWRTE
jgi:hypothetical protein